MQRGAARWAGHEDQRQSTSRILEDPRTGKIYSWQRPPGQLLATATGLCDMSKPGRKASPGLMSAELDPSTQDPGAGWDGAEQDAQAGKHPWSVQPQTG